MSNVFKLAISILILVVVSFQMEHVTYGQNGTLDSDKVLTAKEKRQQQEAQHAKLIQDRFLKNEESLSKTFQKAIVEAALAEQERRETFLSSVNGSSEKSKSFKRKFTNCWVV